MTTCGPCGQRYDDTADGRWRHRFIYSHTPSPATEIRASWRVEWDVRDDEVKEIRR